MKSITVKEPTIWELADQIQTIKDMIADVEEVIKVQSKINTDFGSALLAIDKLFGVNEKKIKELDKRYPKKR